MPPNWFDTLHYLNPKLTTFKMVMDLVEDKEHKTLEGLNKIIEILYGENNGTNNNEYEREVKSMSVKPEQVKRLL